jgi:hypothetical protein
VTPEPISREQRELASRDLVTLILIGKRLLAALEAGEALAEALDEALAIHRYFAEMRRPDAIATVQRGEAALAAWRARVQG